MLRSMTTTSGASSRCDPHRLGAAGCLADDLDALLLEQVPESGAEEVVVVDDQHAKRVGLTLLGCLQHFAQITTPSWRGILSGA